MKSRQTTLLSQVRSRIDRKRNAVVLRQDFRDLGKYDQVGRCLLRLVKEGRLIKIGQGIYVRAAVSPLDEQPALPKSLNSLAVEAMQKMGIPTGPTATERDYNEGKSTQVPTGRTIGVCKRVRRHIGYNGYTMKFEHVT
ncbi:DUF6088 family protein [Chlorobium phaeovibrioides]|uniref:Type IV toxin-antitoxin system AbiEi family antitoxin domain-containing protein n=1 Tax=Chlorobium phaeovibrioides TaxID=1094 RepID=A0A5M8I819_CHLPH|nr:DUF6088 family protein [Chlorobium phaeovibrioides]KAA6230389.1 type IV toxin-antitoxin system AbiEi family antitoxin domain-containing protein [Chlorobium phaeovibrioides]MDT9547417.1 DUF6088 family protein [Chlorobium phaeovibrioides]MWV54976.1 hypothetical protein [Chlorobium phaeovibrioides]